jgi:hypothetical protein
MERHGQRRNVTINQTRDGVAWSGMEDRGAGSKATNDNMELHWIDSNSNKQIATINHTRAWSGDGPWSTTAHGHD